MTKQEEIKFCPMCRGSGIARYCSGLPSALPGYDDCLFCYGTGKVKTSYVAVKPLIKERNEN